MVFRKHRSGLILPSRLYEKPTIVRYFDRDIDRDRDGQGQNRPGAGGGPAGPLFTFNGDDVTQFDVVLDTRLSPTVSGGLIRQAADAAAAGLWTAWLTVTLAPAADFVVDFTWRKSHLNNTGIFMMFLGENKTDTSPFSGGDKYIIQTQSSTLRFSKVDDGTFSDVELMDGAALSTDVDIRIEIFDLGPSGIRFVVTKDPTGTPVEIMDRTEATPPADLGQEIGIHLTAAFDPNEAAIGNLVVDNAA